MTRAKVRRELARGEEPVGHAAPSQSEASATSSHRTVRRPVRSGETHWPNGSGLLDINARTVRAKMDDGMTLSVTMVRPGPVPSFEVGAYEYVGRSLPSVGETILIRKVVGGEQTYGYVTRVNPFADTPICGHRGCERTKR